ncbi:hypothetical protein B0A50_06083 [Salinomyces thailandicus]|uniref:BTB domain-containing protein n=1 Tax=Salinomyces thailandicus TaxID=706561 RepID=A0A4U0TT42_9PEZI|nr:hypothetical protein B0A50_06083 [Salinomyces thailandica]
MSHCHDEHDHHGHDHSEGAAHDHSDDITPALQNHVYEPIDFSAINTLNESEPRAGAKVVQKTWMERMDHEPELSSDADEQLLMHVPFTGQVRLHSILLRTSDTSHAPSTLKLFINRDDLDFSTASSLPPTQTLELPQSNELQEIGIKRALFNTVRSLDLFFEDNWGQGDEDVTRVSYIGFKGEWMKLSREPVNFLYEAAANPGDHKMVSGVGQRLGSDIGGAGGSHAAMATDGVYTRHDLEDPDTLESKPVKVTVGQGSEQSVYYVHETLIRTCSAFFDAALSQKWGQGEDKVVLLPDDSPSLFADYLSWLYWGHWSRGAGGLPQVFAVLGQLYVLGEKLLDDEFQNAVMDKMSQAGGGRFVRSGPLSEFVDILYAGTPAQSPARRFVIDFYVRYGAADWVDKSRVGVNVEFADDLLRAFFNKPVGEPKVLGADYYHKPQEPEIYALGSEGDSASSSTTEEPESCLW